MHLLDKIPTGCSSGVALERFFFFLRTPF